jgi:cation diffusion facilitator CzcD-associated flavoprotein CzcO
MQKGKTEVAKTTNSRRVAIIGAGLGGVAMAVKLKMAGIDTFTVYERAAGPGGVWWHNTYPGCEVDVPSLAYSYSFIDYPWQATHASQAELREYIEFVITRFGLADHTVFERGVSSARWDSASKRYDVALDDGTVEQFDLVVSALGMLSEPNLPTWPGLAQFEGPVFHTSRYRHDLDLSQKRVALVGTGSTACQLGPELAKTVKQLDLYQREPGYVMPKRVTRYTQEEIEERSKRERLRKKFDRYRALYDFSKFQGAFNSKSDTQTKLRSFAESYIDRSVEDADVRKALTPSYPYGCKRPVFASGYYKMFNRGNVQLVAQAVCDLTANGVVDALGVERPADVVILATGFQATKYQKSIDVYGRNGQSLDMAWGDEPWAFLGITVPGFPNFFMMYGPNTNGGGSIISSLERQAEAILSGVRRVTPGATVIETRGRVAEVYDAWVQRRLKRRSDVFDAGCHNYYRAASGKNVTQLPMKAPTYLVATRVLKWVGWKVDRR